MPELSACLINPLYRVGRIHQVVEVYHLPTGKLDQQNRHQVVLQWSRGDESTDRQMVCCWTDILVLMDNSQICFACLELSKRALIKMGMILSAGSMPGTEPSIANPLHRTEITQPVAWRELLESNVGLRTGNPENFCQLAVPLLPVYIVLLLKTRVVIVLWR